jgi:hypothetical protein
MKPPPVATVNNSMLLSFKWIGGEVMDYVLFFYWSQEKAIVGHIDCNSYKNILKL